LVKGLLRCCEVEESRVGVIRAEPPEAFSNEAEAFVKEVQALKPKPLPMLRKTPVSTGRILFTDLLRHLLRSAGLKQRELRTSLFGVVRIDRDRCTRCFVCPTVCPTGALEATEGRLMFSHDACVNCKSCLEICPEEAVEVEEAMKLDLLISPACLLEEELLACERCGSPFIPRHMLQRVGERLRLTEEAKGLLKLCPECRAKQSSPFKDVG
jgi:ferredoxin